MTTLMPKEEDVERKWFLVDAQDRVLGRLATQVATVLRGKHKPQFSPHLDVGDHVVVINAEKIHLTGRKLTDKIYRWHSGYIGGLREVSAERMIKTHPERVIEWAVQGMLPKGRLGRAMAKKLKVYKGAEHPHAAQKPEPLAMRERARCGAPWPSSVASTEPVAARPPSPASGSRPARAASWSTGAPSRTTSRARRCGW